MDKNGWGFPQAPARRRRAYSPAWPDGRSSGLAGRYNCNLGHREERIDQKEEEDNQNLGGNHGRIVEKRGWLYQRDELVNPALPLDFLIKNLL